MDKTLKEIIAAIRSWEGTPVVLAYLAFVIGVTLCATPGYTWQVLKIAHGIALGFGGVMGAIIWSSNR